MERAAEDCRAAGRRPLIVPLGASTPLGALGFARGVVELATSSLRPDVIVHATSSGGTQAGLLAGCALLGLSCQVLGVSADDPAGSIVDRHHRAARRHRRSPRRDGRRTSAPAAPSTSMMPKSARDMARRRLRRRKRSRSSRGERGSCSIPSTLPRPWRADPTHPRRRDWSAIAPCSSGTRVARSDSSRDADLSRRRAHRHRIEAPARGGRHAAARRLRACFRDSRICGERNWQPLPVRADSIEAVDSDARASRSLRLSAAAGRAGIQGTDLVHAGDRRPRQDRARRRREAPGRGRRARQPQGLHQAPARAAAVHHRRTPTARWRCCSRSGTSGRCPVDAWRDGRVHQRGTPARLGLRARAHRVDRQDDSLWRRSRPVRPARAARSAPPPGHADVLLVESTYGDRVHAPRRRRRGDGRRHQRHGATRRQAHHPGVRPRSRRGAALLDSTGSRTQRRIPELPVYVDSPMAAKVLEEYRSRLDELDPDDGRAAAAAMADGARPSGKLCAFCTAKLTRRGLDCRVARGAGIRAPAIVISSSGMATGGRVLHHLARALPESEEHRAASPAIRRPARAVAR